MVLAMTDGPRIQARLGPSRDPPRLLEAFTRMIITSAESE